MTRSIFDAVTLAPRDPILGLTEAYVETKKIQRKATALHQILPTRNQPHDK
jgi:hypothetical protein